jgi:hypothetical protein
VHHGPGISSGGGPDESHHYELWSAKMYPLISLTISPQQSLLQAYEAGEAGTVLSATTIAGHEVISGYLLVRPMRLVVFGKGFIVSGITIHLLGVRCLD